jgi:hypothetical protein
VNANETKEEVQDECLVFDADNVKIEDIQIFGAHNENLNLKKFNLSTKLL